MWLPELSTTGCRRCCCSESVHQNRKLVGNFWENSLTVFTTASSLSAVPKLSDTQFYSSFQLLKWQISHSGCFSVYFLLDLVWFKTEGNFQAWPWTHTHAITHTHGGSPEGCSAGCSSCDGVSIREHIPCICLPQFKPVVNFVRAQTVGLQNLLSCAKCLSFIGYETSGLLFESTAAKSWLDYIFIFGKLMH